MNLQALSRADWLTSERVRGLVVVGAILAIIGLGVDFAGHTTTGLTDAGGEALARDFINYWSGAHLAADGHAAAAYDKGGFLRFERSIIGQHASFRWYGYPPVAMLLSLPLAGLPFLTGLGVWLAAGWALTARLLSGDLGWKLAIAAAIGAPAAYINAGSGQNGAFTAVLLAGGLMLLDRRPILAGVLLGALCYKPQFGLLLPIALAAGGRWRTILSAGATVIALVLLSVAAFGVDAWTAFLHAAPFHRYLLETFHWRRITTVFMVVRMLGGGVGPAYAAQAVSSVLTAVLIVAVWRSRASTALKSCALTVGVFLATPYAWDYDMIILTFTATWFVREAGPGGFRPWEKLALATALIAPITCGTIAAVSGIQIMPALLWGLLILIARRALAAPADSRSRPLETVPQSSCAMKAVKASA